MGRDSAWQRQCVAEIVCVWLRQCAWLRQCVAETVCVWLGQCVWLRSPLHVIKGENLKCLLPVPRAQSCRALQSGHVGQ